MRLRLVEEAVPSGGLKGAFSFLRRKSERELTIEDGDVVSIPAGASLMALDEADIGVPVWYKNRLSGHQRRTALTRTEQTIKTNQTEGGNRKGRQKITLPLSSFQSARFTEAHGGQLSPIFLAAIPLTDNDHSDFSESDDITHRKSPLSCEIGSRF